MNYDLKAIIILSTGNNRQNTTELLNSVQFLTFVHLQHKKYHTTQKVRCCINKTHLHV